MSFTAEAQRAAEMAGEEEGPNSTTVHRSPRALSLVNNLGVLRVTSVELDVPWRSWPLGGES